MTGFSYKTSGRETPVYIENGLLENVPTLLPPGITEIFLLTDSNIGPLYAGRLCKALAREGYNVTTAALAAGEVYKNWATVGDLLNQLGEAGITKTGAVLALGGGVVGDTAAFAAAVYLRGIKLFQIPTTLLAQVDSSVGGKCGVNLASGKNRAGVIRQPDGVFIDPLLLETLPPREIACGMAEVIKYAAAFDAEMFRLLETGSMPLEQAIARGVQIKARIVEQDEHDEGERQLLNFGHTLGHAIEKLGGYSKYNHGEAVAIGMCSLSRLAHEAGMGCEPSRLLALCEKFNLPTRAGFTKEEMLQLLPADKKCRGEKLTLILLEEIGKARRVTVSLDEWRAKL